MSTTPRVLVLGAGGMLGHKMLQTAAPVFADTWGTLRGDAGALEAVGISAVPRDQLVPDCDVMDLGAVDTLLDRLRPDVVVNCVGVIKQRSAAHDALPSITINALLPHRLADRLARWDGRLIHVSTDCVFDGRRGEYTEDDLTNAEDLYGRSKAMGEVTELPNALTLRTSIVGRELRNHQSLLDWALSQNYRTVKGFERAWWSGVTTNHLAALITALIVDHPGLAGLYQVSSGRISKFALLHLIRDAYRLDMEIVPEESYVLDRSLSPAKLRDAIGYQCPPLAQLVAEMAADPTSYQHV